MAENPPLFLPADYETDVTLRDLFAGMAMQALIEAEVGEPVYVMARYAYEQADAMLAEREKPRAG